MKQNRQPPLQTSISLALQGIFYTLKSQRNFKIHLLFSLVVILLGYMYSIETTEWLFIICVIGFVLVAELFNTAIETSVDLTTTEIHPLAKLAKDVAAGGVLMAAITASVVGMIIFIPKILSGFGGQ